MFFCRKTDEEYFPNVDISESEQATVLWIFLLSIYILVVLQHEPTVTELQMLNAFQHYAEICMCTVVEFVHLTVTVKTKVPSLRY